MARDELIEAYRRGEVGPVTFVRRLLKLGLSASAALGLALALSSPAAADDGKLNPPGLQVSANVIANIAQNNPNLSPTAANVLNRVASSHLANLPPGQNRCNFINCTDTTGKLPLE